MADSQNEERKSWYKAFSNYRRGIIANMHNAFIAKVVKYNKKDHTADIQPLAMRSNGEVLAQYLDVPVATSCYAADEWFDRVKPEFSKIDAHCGSDLSSKFPKKRYMRAGVPVVCVVLDRDNDNWEGGRAVNTYMPNSSRMHDANDAIIVGVLGGDAING